MSWQAGRSGSFKGKDNQRRNRLFQRAPDATGAYEGGKADLSGLDDPRLEELVTPEIAAHVRDEAELAMAGYAAFDAAAYRHGDLTRSEEHTSELQSLMRISYAVFCLKKKKKSY